MYKLTTATATIYADTLEAVTVRAAQMGIECHTYYPETGNGLIWNIALAHHKGTPVVVWTGLPVANLSRTQWHSGHWQNTTEDGDPTWIVDRPRTDDQPLDLEFGTRTHTETAETQHDHDKAYASRKQIDPIEGINRKRRPTNSTFLELAYGHMVDAATAAAWKADRLLQPMPPKTYRLRTAEGVRLSSARGAELIEKAMAK